MTDPVTRIARAYPDRVEVRGRDLTGDLMGRLTFTEYVHLLLTGEEPTEEQRFFLDLLLVAIAEHGMMPTSIAARMTLAADPRSLQGAVAAGILGAGPVVLGTAEECARLLDELRVTGRGPEEAARELHDAGAKIPGFGSFGVSERASRKGRNPATGASITIKASKSVRFKAGKDLKETVNKKRRSSK